jgi:alanyl-tRNA synthetase
MGTGIRGTKAGRPYSVELCGGTHVGATGEIGLVRIVGESAVAAGVRRLEALTGEAARAYLAEQDERVKTLAASLKVQQGEVLARVDALLDERRRLERELTEAKKKLALGGGGGSAAVAAGRTWRRRAGRMASAPERRSSRWPRHSPADGPALRVSSRRTWARRRERRPPRGLRRSSTRYRSVP